MDNKEFNIKPEERKKTYAVDILKLTLSTRN